VRGRALAAALVAGVALALAGCGGDEAPFDRAFIDGMVKHH